MTTIVADRELGLMAADRMITANDGEVAIACETKIEFIQGYLVGCAGLEGPAIYFMEWLENGDWEEPPEPIYDIAPDDDFSALLLGPDGLWVADKFCRLSKIDHRRYAAGSGGVFAWAVLEAGCGIEKAMETAIKLDPHSGFGYEIAYIEDYE